MKSNLSGGNHWLRVSPCLRLAALVLATAPGFTVSSLAETAPDTGAVSTPPTSPLPMPRDFDAATVRRLLTSIDAPQAASMLKLGYFNRRGTPTLPAPEGFATLKSEIAKEREGSKRWFLLQEVRGWAAFRVPGVSTDEGFAAYEAVFARAADAQPAGATHSLSASIGDYVLGAVGRFGTLGLRGDKRVAQDLLLAWTAYYRFVDGRKGVGGVPLWREAIAATQTAAELRPLVEKSLADPQTEKTYGLLQAAAEVFFPSDTMRALALLRQARLLVPPDPEEAGRFYDRLVEVLIQSETPKDGRVPPKAFAEAVVLQQERIKLTGRGRGTLARLYGSAADWGALEKLAGEVSVAGVPLAEANDVAQSLLGAAKPAGSAGDRATPYDQAIRLLNEVLKAAPTVGADPRSLAGQRFRTRYLLAQAYAGQGKWTEATAVLDAPELKQPPPEGLAMRYATLMKRLRSTIDSRDKEKAPKAPPP